MTPNLMLDDDVLTQLLREAGESFPVPAEGPDLVLDDLAVGAGQARRGRLVKVAAAAAALVAGVLVVQSLGGGSAATKSSPSALPAAAPSAAPQGLSQTARTADSEALGRRPAQSSVPLPASAGVTAAGPGVAPAARPPASSSTAAVADGFADSAKIVKTGTVSLIVVDGKVGPVVGRVTAIADSAGGYVSNAKTQEYGDDPTSTVSVRVPVAKFEAVVQAVRDTVKNGVGKIDSSSTSGQDVTAQYADVNAQIQSLTAARDRFLTILSRANTIGETLSVQQRVDSVQQQIDQLRGRMRVLADQTSMGTLTVTVSEKAKAESSPHVQSGLSKSFDSAKHGFTSGVESLVAKSGRGLLVLLVAVLALVILRTGWRVARRRVV